MALKLHSTMTIQKYINCLVYGDSGVGKTVLLGTAPKPLILAVEKGILSLSDQDIPMFEIRNRDHLNEAYEWLDCSAEAKKKYSTICIDSVSEAAEILLAEEKANNKDGRAAYGTMADLMAITIRSFIALKYHTVFTAKLKKLVDEDSGAISYMPSVPGQMLLNNLPYMFDEVLLMDIGKNGKEEYRYLNTVKGRQYIAKDRSGKLLPKEKPDLTYIFDKILKSGEPMTKAPKAEVKPKVKPTVQT